MAQSMHFYISFDIIILLRIFVVGHLEVGFFSVLARNVTGREVESRPLSQLKHLKGILLAAPYFSWWISSANNVTTSLILF